MELSHRITHMTPDDTGGWAHFFKTRALQAQGVEIIDLTIGEHDRRTDPEILDAMHRSAVGGHTGYAALPGTAVLRDEIAARVEARTGVPTKRENVLVTAGGQAALFAAHNAALDDGDRALFCDPYYPTYPGTIGGVGGMPVPVLTRAEDRFQPKYDAIMDAANADPAGAKSLLINTPNNPTGAIYDRSTIDGIARAAQDANLWLISDEVYDTMVWDGSHETPRALPGMADRTLVVGSMSKSHAMTGSRIGWIVGPEAAIAAMGNLVVHTTYGVPGFVQDAALFALRLGDAFESEIARPFRERRTRAMALIEGQNVVRASPASGAMYLMLDIRATGLSGDAFADRLLEEERISLMPGESFGTASSGHVRIAMTADDSDFDAAIARILKVASAWATAK